VIKSFKDGETKAIFERTYSGKKFSAIAGKAKRRLDALDAAASLPDLAALNSNRLEALHGDRDGQYSIRVDRQYRVCFAWKDGNAENVEVVDYH
jgi:toxin HigB-1